METMGELRDTKWCLLNVDHLLDIYFALPIVKG